MAQLQQAGAKISIHYKWIALSNTTLGVLMATINSSILLISLPAIFNGIGINPLAPGETNYFLWMLLGYMVITATLLVTFGRISDIYGRVKMYNLGFTIFTVASILLFFTPGTGNSAALYIILIRLLQGVGGGFLFANSAAIITDAFPINQRGGALGINQIAAIFGSIIGLILGGVLSVVNWRLIFLVNVPFGVLGTIWAYLMLKETATLRESKHIDWLGNVTFAIGLTALLLGITYGIEPYGSSNTSWTSPFVLTALIGGSLLLIIFILIELRVKDPMFRMDLFRIRMFSMGNIANFFSSLARGGLQFMLVIWLQGIWLPLHGYNYADTPLWAGIYIMPLLAGFIIMGPISGMLSDRFGPRALSTVGMIIQAIGFLGLTFLPADFNYVLFAVILFALGLGQGMFAAPNTSSIMNSVPANTRGVSSGMRATFQNAASVFSIGVFFSIIISGLGANLPAALSGGLVQVGFAPALAAKIGNLPPTAALFAAFLGYNPLATIVPAKILHTLTPANQAAVIGKTFFPTLISGPFMTGLHAVFIISIILCFIAAAASFVKDVSPKMNSASAADASGEKTALPENNTGDQKDAAAAAVVE